MIMSKLQFDELKRFGLSDYEIKAYVTLLTKGPLTSTEIVKQSGIPQPRVYDVLQNLSAKGLVEYMQGDKRRTYIAVPPRIGLKKVIREMDNYIENFERRLTELKKDSFNIIPQIWIVEKDTKIIEKTREIISSSRNEIIVSAHSKTIDEIIGELNDASDRGVTVALVIYPDVDEKILQKFNPRIIIKRRDIEASEVIIGDRSIGLLRVESGGKENYGLYFKDDEIIHILNYYFYHTIWQPSKYINDFLSLEKISLNTAWLCCEAGKQLLLAGKKIRGEFEVIMNNKKHRLTANLVDVEVLPGLKHTIYIEHNGKRISLGGKTARVEDARLLNCRLEID